MALTAVVSRDSALREHFERALDREAVGLLFIPSLSAAKRLLRERPVSVVVLDSTGLPPRADRAAASVEGLRRRFPSVPLGVVAHGREAHLLRALGADGLRHLLLQEEVGPRAARRFLLTLRAEDAASRVVSALSPVLGRWELGVVRQAMDRVHAQLDAEAFAAELGCSRPHLSRRLAERGLPSTGELLRWALLFHAGHWLPDPGRSGESVGRQLEYANGSTFRRALRNLVAVTPTELAEVGLPRVIDAFVERTGLELPQILRVA